MTTDGICRHPISIDDFLRLKAFVGDRDRHLRLELDHTDIGEAYISVMIKGVPDAFATIIRGENGWLVHHPEDGPLYEFGAIPEVANFLAFGDTKCCRRSWTRAPWCPPAETTLGPSRERVGSCGREEIPKSGSLHAAMGWEPENQFAADSPLEEAGFEPLVPLTLNARCLT